MKKHSILAMLAFFFVGCSTLSVKNQIFVSPDKKHEVSIDNSSVLLIETLKAIDLRKNRSSDESYNAHIVSINRDSRVKIRWLSNEEILIRCDELADEEEKMIEGILIRFE